MRTNEKAAADTNHTGSKPETFLITGGDQKRFGILTSSQNANNLQAVGADSSRCD